jgi:hypothetical protein
MRAVPFDSHAVAKELKAAGFTNDQAEAVTRVVRNAQAVDLSSLATRSDGQRVGRHSTEQNPIDRLFSDCSNDVAYAKNMHAREGFLGDPDRRNSASARFVSLAKQAGKT